MLLGKDQNSNMEENAVPENNPHGAQLHTPSVTCTCELDCSSPRSAVGGIPRSVMQLKEYVGYCDKLSMTDSATHFWPMEIETI